MALVTLVDSGIPQPDSSAARAATDTASTIEINVILQRPLFQGMTLQQYTDAVIAGSQPTLTHEAFDAAFAVPDADLDAVVAYTQQHGIAEKLRNSSAGYVKLTGTVAAMNAAFGITLEDVTTASRTYRSYVASLTVDDSIADKIMHVMGLDTYMTVVKHLRRHDRTQEASPDAAAVALTPPQVAAAYQFPSGTGAGAHIGIVEVGGGYISSDVNSSFSRIGITPPTIVDISVNGGANYGVSGSASDETMLDIYCCGGVAHNATLYMYFGVDAVDLNTGLTAIYDTVNAAVTDTVNNPSVISVSYGFGQSYWNSISGLVAAFESTFQAGITKGISIFVASGDDGAQGRDDTAPSTGYPGSSPYCISCGGTSLQLSGSSITSETVWNQGDAGTGGGISTFALPSYQTGLGLTATPYTTGPGSPVALTYRGMPDLAANSDPATGYEFYLDGSLEQVGGTSAAAPLLAGMAAVMNINLNSRIGFINSKIYTNSSAFNDITSGNNCCTGLQSTGWAATSGWDACTGMGSPRGTVLQALFQSSNSVVRYPINTYGTRPGSGAVYPRVNSYATATR